MQQKLRSGKNVNFGCWFDPYDQRDYLFSLAPRELPVQIDNRSEVVRIMNQNPEGACTGFALCATAEFHYWRRSGKKIDLSQRWAYRKARENDRWPGENYHGSSTRAAIKGWAAFGICEENYWEFVPYQVLQESSEFDLVKWEGEPEKGAEENALQYPLQSYRRCRTMYDIKHAIHEYGLVIVGAGVHSGWDIWGEDTIHYSDNVYYLGGHAFILIGYKEIERIFYIANSWGPEWGIDGFGKYSYDDARENIRDAWTVSVPQV
jgi:hypothetical protein